MHVDDGLSICIDFVDDTLSSSLNFPSMKIVSELFNSSNSSYFSSSNSSCFSFSISYDGFVSVASSLLAMLSLCLILGRCSGVGVMVKFKAGTASVALAPSVTSS